MTRELALWAVVLLLAVDQVLLAVLYVRLARGARRLVVNLTAVDNASEQLQRIAESIARTNPRCGCSHVQTIHRLGIQKGCTAPGCGCAGFHAPPLPGPRRPS